MSTDVKGEQEKIRRFRDRADECRAHAADMKELDARTGLIRVADAYDRMASAIEAKLGANPPGRS